VSSDGNTVYAFDGYNIDVFDALTMAMKRTFPVSASQSLINYPTMFLSRDEKTAFITDGSSNGVLDAYDVSTGTFVGWMPQLNLAASGSYSGDTPIYQAMDQNGIAAGVITSEGVGFMDSTAVHTPPIGTPFMQTQLLVPYGPVGGGTADSWLPSIFGLSTPPPLGSVYFGANPATDLGNNSFEGAMIFAVNPAGTPGPVDVRTFSTDGGSQLLPAGFSYGPWILESPTMYSTAEGGSSATLYGYAFGPQTYTGGATYIAPPLDLQVTVGSTPATVTAFSPNPYVNDVYYSYFTAPPTPKNSLLVTIPPGTPGTTASITVTNSTGSNGASTITYLGAVQQVPVNGELVDGIYDPYRDVYYFSDATQVRVFSLSSKAVAIFDPDPGTCAGLRSAEIVGIRSVSGWFKARYRRPRCSCNLCGQSESVHSAELPSGNQYHSRSRNICPDRPGHNKPGDRVFRNRGLQRRWRQRLSLRARYQYWCIPGGYGSDLLGLFADRGPVYQQPA